MRLIFAGTPPFAAEILEAAAAWHEVALVLTQPEKPQGRGLGKKPSAVKAKALALGLPVAEPEMLDAAFLQETAALSPDWLVVAAYGKILPPGLLLLPRFGAVNVHASLLPRWRGANPVARAIEAGDETAGISLMKMEKRLDSGPVWCKKSLAISPEDTCGSLSCKLAALGREMLLEFLLQAQEGTLPQPETQDERLATTARKFSKEELFLDWKRNAASLERQVRAMMPDPAVRTLFRQKLMKVFKARPQDASCRGDPGEVIGVTKTGIEVAAAEGSSLVLEEVQLEGKKRLPAWDCAQGLRLREEEKFALPHPRDEQGSRA